MIKPKELYKDYDYMLLYAVKLNKFIKEKYS
jgi:hypothetical protein